MTVINASAVALKRAGLVCAEIPPSLLRDALKSGVGNLDERVI